MQQPLLIALLLTAFLATTVQSAPEAITVYVHDDQPVANMPVTATSGQQVINASTDASGIAPLAIDGGVWVVETCGQTVLVETLDEDQGPGGLLVVECHRVYIPAAVK